jgi:hypothetical protein
MNVLSVVACLGRHLLSNSFVIPSVFCCCFIVFLFGYIFRYDNLNLVKLYWWNRFESLIVTPFISMFCDIKDECCYGYAQQQHMSFLQNQNAQLVANQQSQDAQKNELEHLRNQNKQLMSQQTVQKSQQDQLDFLMNQNLLMQELHKQQMNLMKDDKVAQKQAHEMHQLQLDSLRKRTDSDVADQQQSGQHMTGDVKRQKNQMQEPQQDQLNHQFNEKSNNAHHNLQSFQQSMTMQVEQSQTMPYIESQETQQMTSNTAPDLSRFFPK